MTTPNTQLRHAREYLCLSRQELAEQVNAVIWTRHSVRAELDANYIGKLERGVITWPGDQYREAVRTILRTSTDTELGFRNTRRALVPPFPEPVGGPTHPESPLHGATVVDERHVQEILGAADMFHRCFQVHGGWSMRAAALAQMHWSAQLIRADVPHHLASALYGAVASLAHICGFMSFDTGDHCETRRIFRFALSCADKAADWHAQVIILASMSRHATWTGRFDEGLLLAEHALEQVDRLTATEQAMLRTARAKALAATQRTSEALRTIGTADEDFSRADPDNDPPWMRFYDLAQHSSDTAEAFMYLNAAGYRTAETRIRFEAAYYGHGDHYACSRAIAHAKLASAVLATEDPAEGAMIGQAALKTAGTIRSALISDSLRTLDQHAARHRGVREAKSLREQLSTRLTPAHSD
ncbi:hypothetical protein [Streptomyces sp. NPDC093544]|uniref:helix-turn-helix domain-containing protein n=1 Tax=Streptomyces sp. NPDC093544 TaxID=3155200 RepID=UPI00343B74D5